MPDILAQISNFIPPTPTIVYHYTALSTMMKIVESRQVWATSIEYLNDTSERNIFLSRAASRLPTYASENADIKSDTFDIFLQDIAMGDESLTSLPFVSSFSQEGDSLPQWRSYCAAGNGVSLGFDVDCLKRASIRKGNTAGLSGMLNVDPPISFRAVEYLNTFDSHKIDRTIREVYEQSVKDANESDEQGWPSAGEFFRYGLQERATFFKDASFQSEAEYRIVVSSLYWRLDMLSFRCNRSTMVPFLKIDIPNAAGDVVVKMADPGETKIRPWSAIRRVYIGPSADKRLTARSLNAYFLSKGMEVQVLKTEVPFRDW